MERISNYAYATSFYHFNKLKIYPVPAKQSIHFEGATVLNVSIYDLSGSLIKKVNVEHNQVDVSTLKSGMYLLQAHDDKGCNSIVRFVVQ